MTRLGTSEQARRSGRYAALMGTWWRHPKRQKLGRAAAGLFTDMLSFCADQGVDRLTERQFGLIAGRDPNVRRQLKELLAAELVLVKDGEYLVRDWYQHNRVAKPVKLRVVGGASEVDATRLATRLVTRLAMNAPPEIIEEPCSPRARASTQDPGVKERTPTASGGAAAPPAPKRAAPKTRPRDAQKAAFKRVLTDACRDGGVLLEGALSRTQLDAAAKKAGEYAEREGIEYETAARKLSRDAVEQVQAGRKSALCWALRDWQPNAAPPAQRAVGGPRYTGPKPCTPAEDFPDTPIEEQLARLAAWDGEKYYDHRKRRRAVS